MIDEHEHCAYLGFAEELLTLCDHPAEMLAAILRMRFKNELLPESYVDLTPKKENVNPDRKGNSRVRFGIGKEDGVSVPEILDFIFDKTKIKSFQLGRIDCGAHETFVNATPEDAKRIVDSFREETVDVSFAEPDDGESLFKGKDRRFTRRNKYREEKREFKRGGKREFSGGRERRGESHDRHLEFHRADRKNFRKGPPGPHKAKKKRD